MIVKICEFTISNPIVGAKLWSFDLSSFYNPSTNTLTITGEHIKPIDIKDNDGESLTATDVSDPVGSNGDRTINYIPYPKFLFWIIKLITML